MAEIGEVRLDKDAEKRAAEKRGTSIFWLQWKSKMNSLAADGYKKTKKGLIWGGVLGAAVAALSVGSYFGLKNLYYTPMMAKQNAAYEKNIKVVKTSLNQQIDKQSKAFEEERKKAAERAAKLEKQNKELARKLEESNKKAAESAQKSGAGAEDRFKRCNPNYSYGVYCDNTSDLSGFTFETSAVDRGVPQSSDDKWIWRCSARNYIVPSRMEKSGVDKCLTNGQMDEFKSGKLNIRIKKGKFYTELNNGISRLSLQTCDEKSLEKFMKFYDHD